MFRSPCTKKRQLYKSQCIFKLSLFSIQHIYRAVYMVCKVRSTSQIGSQILYQLEDPASDIRVQY